MGKDKIKFDWGETNTPVHRLAVTIPVEDQKSLLSAIRKFAEIDAFELSIRPMHPREPQISVDFWKEDIAVLGDNITDVGRFNFMIYLSVTKPASTAVVKELAEKLETVLRGVPGAKLQ